MENEKNPYEPPIHAEPASIPKPGTRPADKAPTSPNSADSSARTHFFRVFLFSYVPSLVVGIAAVPAYLIPIMMAAPAGLRRTRPPELWELGLIFITTLPSILTCLGFSECYCKLCHTHAKAAVWPAVVFGILSGLFFNAVTSVSVIEYFFKW